MPKAIAPECTVNEVGIRPGEKLHEALLSEDEARTAIELDRMFIIRPAHSWWNHDSEPVGRALPEGFSYMSNTNSEWLGIDDLRRLIGETPVADGALKSR